MNNEAGEDVDPTTAWAQLEVQDYGPFFMQDYTQFFTSEKPLELFVGLIDYLNESNVEYQISGEKLAVKFEAQLSSVAAAKSNNQNQGEGAA